MPFSNPWARACSVLSCVSRSNSVCRARAAGPCAVAVFVPRHNQRVAQMSVAFGRHGGDDIPQTVGNVVARNPAGSVDGFLEEAVAPDVLGQRFGVVAVLEALANGVVAAAAHGRNATWIATSIPANAGKIGTSSKKPVHSRECSKRSAEPMRDQHALSCT